ncbi:retroviral-like aspartic protease family protein [uncultured Brevundimonas sp.]|uniref:retroviral-like aspartic protease family protein n=1 Tax=uncultured Brevundimonas sp. TaxID=213418 RepID=UPI0030ED0848|tara:strand:- start:62551 stop:63459 length:909 start_codon:yes stop_codon:yes gene_type:complete
MVTRRILIATAASLAADPLPALAWQESFDSEALHRGRATVSVFLNGEGPFNFMVDTAANASVISSDVAERLQLESLGEIGMHTLVAREVVPAVRVSRMESGTLDARNVTLAVGQRTAMAGLDGMLGCDLLVDRKLILNFRGTQRVRIARSNSPPRGFLGRRSSGIPLVVAGERLMGSLLMIPARIGRASTVAIIDSGADGTILNRAAAEVGRATLLVPGDGQIIRRVQSPTGEVTTGRAMLLPSLNFAGITISDLAVAVGDFHSFRVWGLEDQPAMLIGLDVLRLFSSVHIDLRRSELSLYV